MSESCESAEPETAFQDVVEVEGISKACGNGEEENDCGSNEQSNSAPLKPVKLPYFHRVLSKEDAALVGNCAPTPVNQTVFKQQESSASSKGASAWNSAGTWEEKNCTETAKDLFTKTIETASPFVSGDYTLTFDSIKDVSGNAQITHVRGKARYLYDFSCDIKFVVTKEKDAEYSSKATIKASEIINDSDWDDYAFTVEFKKSPADALLVRKALTGKDAKNWLKKICGDFEAKYKEL